MTRADPKGRWLVKLRDSAAVAQTLADCGIYEYRADLAATGWIGVSSAALTGDSVERLRAHGNVQTVLAERRTHTTAVRNGTADDTFTADPNADWFTWAYARSDVYRAWKIVKDTLGTLGSAAIRVVVTDTGFYTHPDLDIPAERRFWGYDGVFPDAFTGTAYHAPGWGSAQEYEWFNYQDFSDPYSQPDIRHTYSGHGELTAGIIGTKHNGRGVSGVAPDATLYVVGLFHPGDQETNPDSINLEMMDAAVPAILGVAPHIISMSIGLTYYPWDNADFVTPGAEPWSDNFRALYAGGSLLIAAASNDYQNLDTWDRQVTPAEHRDVICVGAMDANGGRIKYSNWGSTVDILAPTNIGSIAHVENTQWEIFDTRPNQVAQSRRTEDGAAYVTGTGTSSATPFVSGACALAWSLNPSLTRAQIRDMLFRTVSPFLDADCETGYYPGNNKWGYPRGVLNMGKLATCAKSTRADCTTPQPYLVFLCRGYLKGQQLYIAQTDIAGNPPQPQTVWHSKDVAGNVTTRLGNADGSAATVWVELAGYSDGADADTVELWLGGRRLYRGPPATLEATAASNGTAQQVKVVAYSGAARAEATYSDVLVSSLTSAAFEPSAFTVNVAGLRLYGTCAEGAAITVDGDAAEIMGTAWQYEVALAPGETAVVDVSDGTDTLTVQVEGSVGGEVPFSISTGFTSEGSAGHVGSPPVAAASVSFSADASDWVKGELLARNLKLGLSYLAGPYQQIPYPRGDATWNVGAGFGADAHSLQVGATPLVHGMGFAADANAAQIAAETIAAQLGFDADAVAVAALQASAALDVGVGFSADAGAAHSGAVSLASSFAWLSDAGYQDPAVQAGTAEVGAAFGDSRDAVYRGPDLVGDVLFRVGLGLDSDSFTGDLLEIGSSAFDFGSDSSYAPPLYPVPTIEPVILRLAAPLVSLELPDREAVLHLPDPVVILDNEGD